MRDLSSYFDWRDAEDSVTSETFDPHVSVIVSDKTVSAEYGSAMLVVDNHTGIEGGKLAAAEMLRALMGLDDAFSPSSERARQRRDTQEKEERMSCFRYIALKTAALERLADSQPRLDRRKEGAKMLIETSNDQDWQTPEWFLTLVRKVAPIHYDPCTTSLNPTRAETSSYPPMDGLRCDWRKTCGSRLIYVNPPYKNLARPAVKGGLTWADKIAIEAVAGCSLLVLVPARTDTKWWQKVDSVMDTGCLLEGRIHFVNPRTGKSESSPKFGNYVGFRGTDAMRARFSETFCRLGRVI